MNIGHISGVASYPSIITINSIGHLTGMALYPCGMHCIGDLGFFVCNGIAHGIFLSRQLVKIVSKFVFYDIIDLLPRPFAWKCGPKFIHCLASASIMEEHKECRPIGSRPHRRGSALGQAIKMSILLLRFKDSRFSTDFTRITIRSGGKMVIQFERVISCKCSGLRSGDNDVANDKIWQDFG